MTTTYENDDYDPILEFDGDLDGTCILACLSEIAAQAVMLSKGWTWTAEDEWLTHDTDYMAVHEEAAEAVCGLVRAGLIRRSDFIYDDVRNAAVRVQP